MRAEVLVKIEAETAAFGESGAEARREVVRILRHAASLVEQDVDAFKLRDVNGNWVGDLDVEITNEKGKRA